MNCQEVQERLSEYLEQSLDDASIRTVDIHLSSCRLCRAEADSLVRCIQNIAGLPTVEPPLGFAQRVMSHVREIEARPSVWERLWFPLGIKMPIHATAIVLIGVLAVYLLEKDEPHKNLLTTPGQVASRSEKKEAIDTRGPRAPAFPQRSLSKGKIRCWRGVALEGKEAAAERSGRDRRAYAIAKQRCQ